METRSAKKRQNPLKTRGFELVRAGIEPATHGFSAENTAFQSLSITLIFQRFSAVPSRKNGKNFSWDIPISHSLHRRFTSYLRLLIEVLNQPT